MESPDSRPTGLYETTCLLGYGMLPFAATCPALSPCAEVQNRLHLWLLRWLWHSSQAQPTSRHLHCIHIMHLLCMQTLQTRAYDSVAQQQVSRGAGALHD